MIVLTENQESFVDGFFKFLFSEEQACLLLGPAGSGKTTVVTSVCENAIPKYKNMCQLLGIQAKYFYTHFTATTNKAAAVLSSAINKHTGTIQSLLGLAVINDYTTGEQKLRKANKDVLISNSIIFIDECSMIDSQLFKFIHSETRDCKFVFIGDDKQLSPVKETISKVFSQGYSKTILNKVIRNEKQPVLQELCNQLRETVSTTKFNPIKITPGIVDHFTDDEVDQFLKENLRHQDKSIKILAYTNKRVNLFNEYLRENRNQPKELQVGEIVVNNSYIKNIPNSLGVDEPVEIISIMPTSYTDIFGDTYSIKNVEVSCIERKGNFKGITFDDPVKHKALMNKLAKAKEWKTFFALQEYTFDLRPFDACTVHKSQGSTFDTVLVDIGDINTCTQLNMAARLLYVAASRAKNRVIFYGHNNKYGRFC